MADKDKGSQQFSIPTEGALIALPDGTVQQFNTAEWDALITGYNEYAGPQMRSGSEEQVNVHNKFGQLLSTGEVASRT